MQDREARIADIEARLKQEAADPPHPNRDLLAHTVRLNLKPLLAVASAAAIAAVSYSGFRHLDRHVTKTAPYRTAYELADSQLRVAGDLQHTHDSLSSIETLVRAGAAHYEPAKAAAICDFISSSGPLLEEDKVSVRQLSTQLKNELRPLAFGTKRALLYWGTLAGGLLSVLSGMCAAWYWVGHVDFDDLARTRRHKQRLLSTRLLHLQSDLASHPHADLMLKIYDGLLARVPTRKDLVGYVAVLADAGEPQCRPFLEAVERHPARFTSAGDLEHALEEYLTFRRYDEAITADGAPRTTTYTQTYLNLLSTPWNRGEIESALHRVRALPSADTVLQRLPKVSAYQALCALSAYEAVGWLESPKRLALLHHLLRDQTPIRAVNVLRLRVSNPVLLEYARTLDGIPGVGTVGQARLLSTLSVLRGMGISTQDLTNALTSVLRPSDAGESPRRTEYDAFQGELTKLKRKAIGLRLGQDVALGAHASEELFYAAHAFGQLHPHPKLQEIVRPIVNSYARGEHNAQILVDNLEGNIELGRKFPPAAYANWRAGHRRRLTAPRPCGKSTEIQLYTSEDPLERMQMGMTPHTCLSLATGPAYFAAFANAIDGNKQVVYQADMQGRKTGRTLAALTDGGIVTFRKYDISSAKTDEAWVTYFLQYKARVGVPWVVPDRFATEPLTRALLAAGAKKKAVTVTLHRAVFPVWFDDTIDADRSEQAHVAKTVKVPRRGYRMRFSGYVIE